MDRRSLLVVAGLALLAGCAGLPIDDGAGVTETLTPVPVTDVESTPGTGDTLPPGVAANGSVDRNRLLEAHAEQLADRSYTYEFSYESAVSDPNVSAASFDRRLVVAGDAFLVEQTNYGVRSNVTLYADEAGAVQRVESGEGVEYERRADVGDPRAFSFTERVVAEYLGWPASNVTAVERDGQRYVRLHFAAIPPSQLASSPQSSVANYSATAYVTPAGLIRTVAVEYEIVGRERRQWVSFRSTYTGIGETTLDRPDWADEAPESTRSPAQSTPPARTETADSATATDAAGTATVTPTERRPASTGNATSVG